MVLQIISEAPVRAKLPLFPQMTTPQVLPVNKKQLNQLKSKTEQILSSLDSILQSEMDYKSLVQTLKTTTASFESLLAELNKSNVLQTIVHPHLLIRADPEFFSRVLLRTKLIPELEVEDEDVEFNEIEIDRFNEQVQNALDILLDLKLELETKQKTKPMIEEDNIKEILEFMSHNKLY